MIHLSFGVLELAPSFLAAHHLYACVLQYCNPLLRLDLLSQRSCASIRSGVDSGVRVLALNRFCARDRNPSVGLPHRSGMRGRPARRRSAGSESMLPYGHLRR